MSRTRASPVVARSDAGITDLASSFRIEHRAVEYDIDLVTLTRHFDSGRSIDETDDLGFGRQVLVSQKVGGTPSFRDSCDGLVGRFLAPSGASRTCSFSLRGHQLGEAVSIHLEARFRHDLRGEVDRESKGVVKLESHVSGQDCLTRRLRLLDLGLEQRQPLLER